jgi:hypothetical protein
MVVSVFVLGHHRKLFFSLSETRLFRQWKTISKSIATLLFMFRELDFTQYLLIGMLNAAV